jgi:hypothetical protein
MFKQFAQEKSHFTFDDYAREMAANPDLLAWFSKPEEAMNKHLYIKIDETVHHKQQMMEQVQNM